MRTLLCAGVLGVITLLPAVSAADDRLLIVAAPELPQSDHLRDEALMIAAGVTIGAAVGYLLPFRAATMVGGLAGGVLSNWWYNRSIDDYEPLVRRNAH
jgi:membrane associated rhomboid family serine protease